MAAYNTSNLIALVLLFFASIVPGEAHNSRRPQVHKFNISKYKVPVSNGSATLASPSGLKLKAITLGRGTQNYTCGPNSSKPPVAIGAVATLFDASSLLQFLPPSEGEELLNLFPSYLVSFASTALEKSPFPVLGHHEFDASGVPCFDLGGKGLLRGKKEAAIAAPKDACKGPFDRGNGAVDWLELCAVAGSKQIQRGYRVETAGGKAPKSCVGQPAFLEIDYAAQYWLYG